MTCSAALADNPGPEFLLPLKYILRFTSRKNRVFLMKYFGMLTVCKQFASFPMAYREWNLLFRLRSIGINAPRPIALHGRCLIREFVDGVPIAERMDDPVSQMEWVVPLSRWLYDFHRYANLKLGDVNLRNFIFQEDTEAIYAIDLEDAKYGNPIEDVGDLVVHILTYRPAFTMKRFTTAAYFLKTYMELSGVDKEKLMEEIRNAFLRASVRRKSPGLLNNYHFIKKIDSLLDASI
jgi:tRNA A-37 threonylcarbamoyl transferase component Bud32